MVVDRLDVTVYSGHITALFGHDGARKVTLNVPFYMNIYLPSIPMACTKI